MFERAKHVECQNNTYISRKSNDRNPIGISTDSTTQRFDNIIHQLFCMFEIVRLNFELRMPRFKLRVWSENDFKVASIELPVNFRFDFFYL